MQHKKEISAVFFKSGDWWVAQCLEHDIAAQAKTPKDLMHQLERAIVGHLVIALEEGIPAFESLPPAPERYWKMFREGVALVVEKRRSFAVKGVALTPEPELHELRVSEPVPA